MMFSRYFHVNHADMSASAPCANASASCAQSANNSMMIILDAIIMASIIICAILSISILGLICLLAILVLVRLLKTPISLWQCEPAI